MKNYVFAAVMLCLSYSNAITAQNSNDPIEWSIINLNEKLLL